MGFRSYSIKLRELDWSFIWGVSAAVEPGSSGGAKIDVYFDHNNQHTAMLTNQSITALTTDSVNVFNDAFPADMQAQVSGQKFRGLQVIPKPNPPTLTPSAEELANNPVYNYKIVIKNTGTSPVTITSAYAFFRKIFPGETLAPGADDYLGFTGDDLTAVTSFYEAVETTEMGDWMKTASDAYLALDPFPTELKSLFATLTPSSTTADYQAVLDSSVFEDFYANQFPKSPFCPSFGQVPDSQNPDTVTLAPNETVELDILDNLAGYGKNLIGLF